jgi:hypothetical protein
VSDLFIQLSAFFTHRPIIHRAGPLWSQLTYVNNVAGGNRKNLTTSRRSCTRFVLIEIRSNFGAAIAASPANETRLQIGQPQIIRPLIGTGRNQMASSKVAAIDQQPKLR